jgi:membrane protein DedA with SNARE-associated domain
METLEPLLASYGLWIVALVVVADQLGLPLPAPPALVVLGGLVGAREVSAPLALAVTTLAVIPADLVWFETGRRRGQGVLRLLCRISLEPDSCVRSTRESFARRGPATLLFAKFVPGLQTIAPPLAGASGMSRTRFLAWSVPAALIWSGSFLALGALLREQVDRFLELLATFGGWLGLVLVGSLALYVAWKAYRRQQFLHALRIARVTPEEVRGLIETGEPPLILDLRDRLQLEGDGRTIPGARVIRLDELEDRHHEIPRDREIILYCT